MAERNIRSFQDFQTEATQIRDVDTEMSILDVDRTPLYVITTNAKRKKVAKNPVFEWPEESDMPMIGLVSNGTVNLASNATGIPVSDATLFGVNDVIQFAKTSSGALADLGTTAVSVGTSEGGESGLSGGLEELALVTAVTLGAGTPSTTTYQIGAVSGTLTVTRAFAGTTPGTVGATQTIRIVATSAQEGGAIDTPRQAYVNMKTSYTQIFETPVQLTRTAMNTDVYREGNEKERAHRQAMAMRRHKLEIEGAGLFGVANVSINGTATRYSTMGVRSIISPFVTDVNGTLSQSAFLASCRYAFRYGKASKLLVAAPIVKEAIDFFAVGGERTKPNEDVYGISLKRFITSFGDWMLAPNFNMGDVGMNYSNEALGIDIPSVSFRPLQNSDTQIFTNHDPTNPKIVKDLVFTQAGWSPKHPARHYRLMGVLAYQ